MSLINPRRNTPPVFLAAQHRQSTQLTPRRHQASQKGRRWQRLSPTSFQDARSGRHDPQGPTVRTWMCVDMCMHTCTGMANRVERCVLWRVKILGLVPRLQRLRIAATAAAVPEMCALQPRKPACGRCPTTSRRCLRRRYRWWWCHRRHAAAEAAAALAVALRTVVCAAVCRICPTTPTRTGWA